MEQTLQNIYRRYAGVTLRGPSYARTQWLIELQKLAQGLITSVETLIDKAKRGQYGELSSKEQSQLIELEYFYQSHIGFKISGIHFGNKGDAMVILTRQYRTMLSQLRDIVDM